MKKVLINKITGNVLGWYGSPTTLTNQFMIKETAENNNLLENEVEVIEYSGSEMLSAVKHKYNSSTQTFETRSDWVPPPVLTQEELDAIRLAQQAQQL